MLGVVAVALAGCWPAPGAGPDRQGFNRFETAISPANVAQLEPAWSAPTDLGAVEDPVVAGGTVHVTSGVSLYGFDVGTGNRRWKKDLDFPSVVEFMGQPFVDGQELLTGEGHGNLGGNYHTNRIDPATGTVLGTLPAPGGMVDAVRGSTYLLERVGFGSGGPFALSVTIVDRNDPNRGWSGLIDITTSSPGPGRPLTLGDDRAYEAGVGTLVSGSTTTRGNGLRAFPVVSPPTCTGPIAGAVCPSWSTPLDGTTSVPPVLDDAEATVFTGTSAGTAYAVDTSTGAVKWSTPVGSAVTASPALAYGKLYVPTADGSLVVLDASTGAPVWSAETGAGIGVQPAVAGGVVFTGSDDGTLHGYDANGCGQPTCDALWTEDTGAAGIQGAPAVSAGQLYVGTGDSRLLAYRLP
jgi:outer membrane protein assembly factor BamB